MRNVIKEAHLNLYKFLMSLLARNNKIPNFFGHSDLKEFLAGHVLMHSTLGETYPDF